MAQIHRLSRDVSLKFNGGGRAADGYTVTAPKGTRLKPVRGGQGISYAIPPGACDFPTGAGGLWAHDSKYYYVWAPSDAVETVEV